MATPPTGKPVPWRCLPEEVRAPVVAALARLASAATGEARAAIEAAVAHLAVRSPRGRKRIAASYRASGLMHELEVAETRGAALDRIEAAVYDNAGVPGAEKALGVSRRTLYRILATDSGARAARERAEERLRAPD